MMSFSKRLEDAMRDLHLNQRQVAGMSGCSAASISQYISGINVPSESKQRDIAVSLGLDADFFTKVIPATKAVKRGQINRILPEQAAKLLGVNKQTLRKGLQQGCFPWGYAIKMDSGRWVYIINADRLAEIEGVNVCPS